MAERAKSETSLRQRGRKPPVSTGAKSATSRTTRQQSPGRKTPSRKSSRQQSAKSPKRTRTISRSSKYGDSKHKDKNIETGASKGCSSITGRRVLAMKRDIDEKNLSTVDMSGQGLTFAHTSVFNKKDVGIVDFSSNNIRGIPPDIKKLTTLVQLDLSKNGIRCLHPNDYGGIPNELSQLPHLEIIIISECNLPFIPPAIWKCTNLKILDISRNKINVLVPEVGNLEQLKHLNAQQTNIATLPPEIAFCQELEELLLWGNSIESLPETMREMPKLQSMTINYRSFCSMVDNYMDNLLKKGQIQSEHIPPVIFEMPGLNVLDLSDTKINTLPEKCYSQLKEFYMENNYFQRVPKMVLGMECLQILDISGNAMVALPEEISALKQLTILRANDNKFSEITGTIGKLTELLELSLGGNQLQLLPNEIGNLSKLKVLILDRNQLKSIPETIVELKELHTLDLTDNSLASLPMNFYLMSDSLTTAHRYQKMHKHGLWLHKNPLHTPPQQVWKTDNPHNIYNYMKKLQIKKTENLNRQKLILIGECQCGKTSLMRSMVTGKSFMTREYDDSTAMVDFKAWKTENNVDLLVFDLGGDSVYKNTHQLFLDHQAMYLMVYDHRKYTVQSHHQAIGCWLDMLYISAPGAVIKLVGTQTDQCYPEIANTIKEQVKEQVQLQLEGYRENIETEIEKVHNHIMNPDDSMSPARIQMLKEQLFRLTRLKRTPLRVVGDVALVSSTEGIYGIPELIQNIEIMAVDKKLFPNGQREIPEQWEQFRMALKRDREYCLTIDQLTTKAQDYGITLTECLQYLKDIGDILWYDNIPLLKDYIFHRPRTLIQTLQGLFNHDMENYMNFEKNKVFTSKGNFDLKLFNQAKEHYDMFGEISRGLLLSFWFYQYLSYDKFNDLVELIPKLDLCYTIPQAEIPLHRYDFQPLMVMPCFNIDKQPDDISDFWPDIVPVGMVQLTTVVTFPVFYPNGLFEKLACRIQDHLVTRTDWQDLVYGQVDNVDSVYLLLTRCLDPHTYDSVLSISVRGPSLSGTQSAISTVHSEFLSLVACFPGIVWYTKLDAKNCEGTTEESFPQSVYSITIKLTEV